MSSKIEWTEETWNPVTGCTKVSAGCKNCYAEVMAKRLKAMGVAAYADGFKLTLHDNRLTLPQRVIKPTLYFVNSMSDLFHERVPVKFIDEVFNTIKATPQHQYQILTKRAERMAAYCTKRNIPSNAILGVSVENKQTLARVAVLKTIAVKRFLSVEPLLEDLGARINFKKIDWVIVGGESGHKARPMDKAWVKRIQAHCEKVGTPFFFKQWGAYGEDGKKRSKQANGRTLDNETYSEMPAFHHRPAYC